MRYGKQTKTETHAVATKPFAEEETIARHVAHVDGEVYVVQG